MRFLPFVLVLSASSFAQQPAPTTAPPPIAQVTGRVSCGDTGQPARFAGVQLIAEKPSDTPLIDPASLGKDPNFEKLLAKAMTAVMKGSNLSTITGLDGTFSLDKVPPGTYYVAAQLPGYLSPLTGVSQMDRMKADDATLKAVESAAEKIVVQPNQSARVDLRLERGASIAGIVRYDDGSPASGVNPILMSMGKDGKWKELGPTGVLPVTTDDRGHYRIYGILAGKYAVKAALPTTQAMVGLGAGGVSLHMNMGDALLVYSGGALREKDVKPIELSAGAEIEGIDIIFPLDNLRTVSGQVVAKADNHAIDAGTVSLTDSETKTALRSAMIGQDGDFRFNYVPDGQYVLHVAGAADTDKSAGSDGSNDFARMMNAKTVKSYGSAELPLTLKDADQTSLSIQVPDHSDAPKQSLVPPAQ